MLDRTRSTRLSGNHFALVDQFVERGTGQDYDVHRLAALEAHGDGVRRVAHRSSVGSNDLVLVVALELRDDFPICSSKGARGHHLDFLRRRRAQTKEQGQGRGFHNATHYLLF